MRLLKLFTWTVLATMTINACRQTPKQKSDQITIEEPRQKSDSLLVIESEFQVDPFGLGDKPLTFLLINKQSSIIDSTEYWDTGIDGRVKGGSYYRLNSVTDSFSVYKRLDGVQFLVDADIASERFPTRHGIKIGMTKAELLKNLNRQDIVKIPRILIVGNLEYSYLVFEFSGERLKRIDYDGYLD